MKKLDAISTTYEANGNERFKFYSMKYPLLSQAIAVSENNCFALLWFYTCGKLFHQGIQWILLRKLLTLVDITSRENLLVIPVLLIARILLSPHYNPSLLKSTTFLFKFFCFSIVRWREKSRTYCKAYNAIGCCKSCLAWGN